MARKQTYRKRYTNQLIEAGETPITQERVKRPPVDPNLQLPYLEGKVILIDKPLHWTSFDVIKRLRSILQIKKIGHAGTLDPLATGLLIVCTGKFTKKINDYMAAEKEYTGTITLGATTPTYDLESDPVAFGSFGALSLNDIEKVAQSFKEHMMQVPTIHSTIKKEGKRVYEMASREE